MTVPSAPPPVPEPLLRFAPAIARVLARHPDLLGPVARRELPTRQELHAEGQSLGECADEETLMVALRRFKYRVVGALILWDLDAGPQGVDRVGAVLSDLADGLLTAALAFGRRPGGVGEDAGDVCVIAMGKHGAQELNYSSDIDIVFLVRSLDGERRRSAERLLRLVVRLLSQVTADGLGFRVDLNLRPEGSTGPPTTSLPAAEQWFLTYGRTWERAAWLKARSAAGDRALGDELLAAIEPFRYRRYLDFGTLDDLATMRDRIAAAARQDALARDLKRGPGGIREIEFLVQATQLAWCGRDPSLRVPSTVPAIRALEARAVLPVPGEPLIEDYRFLRALEHRVQWEREAQTQRVPEADDEPAWERLGASFGQRGPELQQRLAEARTRVEEAWFTVFRDEEPPKDNLDLMDPFSTEAEHTDSLRSLGFVDPEGAAARLRHLAQPNARGRMRPSTWRRFERVAPQLTTLAARSGNPDEALARIERFVGRVGARGTTYELLYENPAVMKTLVRVFADSALLSERLIHHPELLDALVLRGRGGETPPQGVESLLRALRDELALRTDDDGGLMALRVTQTVELLRIGLADLAGALPGLACPWLSALAEALVVGADAVAERAMEARHGLPRVEREPLPRAVVALGSLGSGWMTYGSDLDLLFVHGDGAASSDGARPLDGRTWMARQAQRTVTALTARTREGTCYEVDLRLRPGGQGGALVASLSGFRAWYAERAAPWERLVMARARVVSASSPEFAAQVERALLEARSLPGGAAELASAARAMRTRQEAELSAERERVLDLKLGPGGLTDVEFAIACAQRAGSAEAQACSDPLSALPSLTVDAADAETLDRGYRFLRRVECALRLRTGTAAAWLRLDDPASPRVAAGLGMSMEALEARVRSERRAIAEVTGRWMAHLW